MSLRSFFTTTLLIAAAVGSWYLAGSFESVEPVQTISDGTGNSFYLRAARILGTDDNGNPLYEIEADYAVQYENREVEMENVRIRYSAVTGIPWRINADRALVTRNQDRLTLSGHVTATSAEGFAGQVTELRAPVLVIDPGTFQAETDSRVQLRIGERSLTGTGMLALLQENRLELKSNVSGKFVP